MSLRTYTMPHPAPSSNIVRPLPPEINAPMRRISGFRAISNMQNNATTYQANNHTSDSANGTSDPTPTNNDPTPVTYTGPYTLNITLNTNSAPNGYAVLLDANNQRVGPNYRAESILSRQAAEDNGNQDYSPFQAYGPTPQGGYSIDNVYPPVNANMQSYMGDQRVIQLHGTSGDAATADAQGRHSILIHGGDWGLPTQGHIRLDPAGINALLTHIDAGDIIRINIAYPQPSQQTNTNNNRRTYTHNDTYQSRDRDDDEDSFMTYVLFYDVPFSDACLFNINSPQRYIMWCMYNDLTNDRIESQPNITDDNNYPPNTDNNINAPLPDDANNTPNTDDTDNSVGYFTDDNNTIDAIANDPTTYTDTTTNDAPANNDTSWMDQFMPNANVADTNSDIQSAYNDPTTYSNDTPNNDSANNFFDDSNNNSYDTDGAYGR